MKKIVLMFCILFLIIFMYVPVYAVIVSGELDANVVPGTSVTSGQKSVTTKGTAVVLGTSESILSVTIKGRKENTGEYIYIGNSTTATSSNGYMLVSGQVVTLDTDNIADIYFDAMYNGDGVSYIALKP